ncbi:MAG: ATP-binding cassette domain-containing protein [Planctomycetales bacterium]|nr:ATP-binding cassette domain-containing protein [Planctomycetales bacterium]MBN8628580.1 ATP-binding cassette domain-containing protein [Planctomycetota bacterium]
MTSSAFNEQSENAADIKVVRRLAAAAVPHLHAHGRPLRKLFEMLGPESLDIRLIVLFAAAVGVLNLASPIAVEALVNSVAFGGLMQPIVVLSLILAGCLLLSAAMTALQFYLAELIQRRIFVRLYDRLLHAFPDAVVRIWEKQDPGVAANRFFEIVTIQKLVSTLLLDGVAIFLTAVIGMVVIAFYHPVLLAFDVVFLLSILVLLLAGARSGPRTAIAESVAKHASAAWLEQVAVEHRSFRSATGRKLADAVGKALELTYLTERSRHFRVVFRQLVGGLLMQVTAVVAMLGIGGWLVLVGQMTLGQLVAAELIVAAVTGSVAKMGKYLESYYDLLASVDKLTPFEELSHESQGGEVPSGAPEGIDLRILGVTLTDDGGRTVLLNVRFTAAPGEAVSILGAEGSGKSLLARALNGDIPPAAGAIEIDGVDLRQWDLAQLREQVQIVDLFGVWEGTIEDNIGAGRPNVSPSDIREALEAVGLLARIRQLPSGLDTVLSVKGGPLSSGETRRMLLARALAARPRLLVLDSCFDTLATSDRLSLWKIIRENYRCTVILTTARPTVARSCEQSVQLTRADASSEENANHE